jgi:nitrite reductase/ring-hydroxylating ferredoxin subunit
MTIGTSIVTKPSTMFVRDPIETNRRRKRMINMKASSTKDIMSSRYDETSFQQQRQQHDEDEQREKTIVSMNTNTVLPSSSSQPPQPPQKKRLSYNQLQLDQKRPFPRTWIPLGSTFELNPLRPNEITFLGLSYIIYQNIHTKEWIVCDNVCSHRLAPLSEGRITEHGHVQCSYHGWTFNNTGHCIDIPQSIPYNLVNQKNIASSSSILCTSQIQTYPVKIHQNIIWSWLWSEDIIEYSTNQYHHLLKQKQQQTNMMTVDDDDDDDDDLTTSKSRIENDKINIPTTNNDNNQLFNIDEIVGDPTVVSTNIALSNCTTYTREVPYSYDILLENIIDPAHIPFVSVKLSDNILMFVL